MVDGLANDNPPNMTPRCCTLLLPLHFVFHPLLSSTKMKSIIIAQNTNTHTRRETYAYIILDSGMGFRALMAADFLNSGLKKKQSAPLSVL